MEIDLKYLDLNKIAVGLINKSFNEKSEGWYQRLWELYRFHIQNNLSLTKRDKYSIAEAIGDELLERGQLEKALSFYNLAESNKCKELMNIVEPI